MKLKNRITLATFIPLLMSTLCFAQGSGSVGGGNITEATLSNYLYKIDHYLQSEEGKTEFPEIAAYDLKHPEQSFHHLVMSIHPVIQDKEVLDQNGVARDCVSISDKNGRRFVCNRKLLPEETLNHQPSFYRLVFHEMLVHAGIELPLNTNVPSQYPVSSRIMETIHLESYQEWVPGKDKNLQSIIGSRCGSLQDDSMELGFGGKYIFAKQDGSERKEVSQLISVIFEKYKGSELRAYASPSTEDLFKMGYGTEELSINLSIPSGQFWSEHSEKTKDLTLQISGRLSRKNISTSGPTNARVQSSYYRGQLEVLFYAPMGKNLQGRKLIKTVSFMCGPRV